MKNLNSKIKPVEYNQIRAQIILCEPCEPQELEVFLQFLQSLSRAIMAQSAIYRNYGSFYKHTLEGLEKDLDNTNQEIDIVQKMLVQYKGFENEGL